MCAAKEFHRQGNMYSSYKNHTIFFKVLIGITRTGAFGIISDTFEGLMSDRYIVIESGLLQNLDRCELVLADGDFTF